MKTPKIASYPGYVGAFTKEQAEGAIPNGSTVMKARSEDGDTTMDGTIGIVLGSIDGTLIMPDVMEKTGAKFMYWIEWINRPGFAVATADFKIARAS